MLDSLKTEFCVDAARRLTTSRHRFRVAHGAQQVNFTLRALTCSHSENKKHRCFCTRGPAVCPVTALPLKHPKFLLKGTTVGARGLCYRCLEFRSNPLLPPPTEKKGGALLKQACPISPPQNKQTLKGGGPRGASPHAYLPKHLSTRSRSSPPE